MYYSVFIKLRPFLKSKAKSNPGLWKRGLTQATILDSHGIALIPILKSIYRLSHLNKDKVMYRLL